MACNFINVGGGSNSCKENFSGVGSTIYIFTKDDLDAKGLKPEYDDTDSSFTPESFAGLTVHKIAVKTKTGKVTCSNNKNGGGFSNVYTGVVANDMGRMSALARIMNNRNDWGILVPAGQGKYYALYDPDFDIEFELSGDTGDAPDSDHGHTLTITQGPMVYGLCTWTPGDGQALDIVDDNTETISTEAATVTGTLVIEASSSDVVISAVKVDGQAASNTGTSGKYQYAITAGKRATIEYKAANADKLKLTWSNGKVVNAADVNTTYKYTVSIDANGNYYKITAS